MLPDGWLTDAEADELRRLAAGKTVLELGAWKGRSTVALAETARYVVSVDRHQGIPPSHLGDSLPDYLAVVRGLANVAIVVASFGELVPLLGRSFDMVYIDGDHDAEAVTRDTHLAENVLHAGSVAAPPVWTIAFHDWDWPDVLETASGILGRDPDALVGSVASYQL